MGPGRVSLFGREERKREGGEKEAAKQRQHAGTANTAVSQRPVRIGLRRVHLRVTRRVAAYGVRREERRRPSRLGPAPLSPAVAHDVAVTPRHVLASVGRICYPSFNAHIQPSIVCGGGGSRERKREERGTGGRSGQQRNSDWKRRLSGQECTLLTARKISPISYDGIVPTGGGLASTFARLSNSTLVRGFDFLRHQQQRPRMPPQGSNTTTFPIDPGPFALQQIPRQQHRRHFNRFAASM